MKSDYTKLPLGAKIGEKEIKKCPHCGRNGLAEEIEGKTYYTHENVVKFEKNHEFSPDSDVCPKK